MRRLLIIFVVLFASGCTESLVAPKIDTSPPAVFEELWHEFDMRYATFPERHVNWDSLHSLYAPRITLNMPDSELLNYFDSLLSPLRDAHDGIESGDGGFGYIHTDSTYAFSVENISSDYLGETANESSDGTIIYGKINDSIGYMNVTTFDLTDYDEFASEIDAVLDSLRNTKALIIDLRGNAGGKGTAGETLDARFMPDGVTLGYNQARYDAVLTHLTAPNPIILNISHFPLWTKPVALLTDRETISEGEWVTMELRTLPNVTVIGDTTQGAFSTRFDRELSNGWTYSMSIWRVTDVNHVCHEGVGLVPDIEIYVRQNQWVVSRDTVLDRAIGFLTK